MDCEGSSASNPAPDRVVVATTRFNACGCGNHTVGAVVRSAVTIERPAWRQSAPVKPMRSQQPDLGQRHSGALAR